MLKRSSFLLVVFIVLSIRTFAQSPNINFTQSYANGDFLGCVKICDEVLALDKNDNSANFYKGASLVKLKKYEEAKAFLIRADKNDFQPKAAIQTNLLRVYAGLQQTEELTAFLNNLAENGFRGLLVFQNEEFEYLSDNEDFKNMKSKVDANANPCKYGDQYQRLDFWLGEWDVYVNNSKIGTSSITKSEGGCTLYEDYKTSSGFLGRSTNYYDPNDELYTQIWIDKFNSITTYKEVSSKKDYLQMLADQGNGNFSRMTYVRDSINGNVTQTMEGSTDYGSSWTSNFLGVYKRKTNPSESEVKIELSNLIKKLDKAIIERDYETLNKVFDDDLKWVAPDGMILNKEMALAALKAKNTKSSMKAISNNDIQITVHDKQAYVIMKTIHSFSNSPDRIYRNIQIFVKENDSWKLELVSSITLSE
jgi:hypothetical protein